MTPRRGSDTLLEVLRTEGVVHVFGNPGTTELPLVDALAAAPDLHYVLGLQEATVVGMADGMARATGRAAFVNLHTAAGVGNAIGNLTNAAVSGIPLVVTAGQQHQAHLVADPMLSGDLEALAAPVAKWTAEVHRPQELGTILRRAFRDAATPPAGPVFVSLPMSVLDEPDDTPVPPVSSVDHRAVAGGLDTLAELLVEPAPGRVALVVGDEVAQAGAVGAAVALADASGSPVFGSPLHGAMVFPQTHPLWRGPLAPAAAAIRAALAGFERVLVVGGQAFLVYPYTEGSPIPDGTELLHLSPVARWPGRTHPVRFGCVGDLDASLRALTEQVAGTVDAAAVAAVRTEAASRRRAEIERLEETARSRYGPAPMHPMAAAHALVRAVPPGTPVVDEAITTGSYVRGFHHDDRPGAYHFCRGGGLGWGMPAAVGVSLGRRSPVLCVVGDGSALYSPQALWTAAHERLPVVFAVVDNGGYRILRDNLLAREGPSARLGRTVGMDLDDPSPDYAALATSFGVPAMRLDHADDVDRAVREALDRPGPTLLVLPIRR